MKKTMINTSHIEGWLYDHTLVKKETGANSKNPGTPFISGTISVATDDAMLNVIPIHFTYVTETTSTGKQNPTWKILDSIVNDAKTVMNSSKDEAMKVRCDSSIDYNEFYSDKSGDEELVRVRRNEGGFVHVITNDMNPVEKERCSWSADMIITRAKEYEADPEHDAPAKVVISGYTFGFRKNLIPVDFTVKSKNGMNYFLGLDASPKNPTFTKVSGQQLSQTITKTITVESAFDEAEVKTVKTSVKDFIVTSAQPNPYVWDDDSSITLEEYQKALADREVELATIKQRQDEYNASKSIVKSGAAAGKDQNDYGF